MLKQMNPPYNYMHMNQPYVSMCVLLREVFRVQLFKNTVATR